MKQTREEYWSGINTKTGFGFSSLAYRAVKARVKDYFALMIKESKKEDGMRPTLTGLCYHLGFRDRQQMKSFKSKHLYDMLLRRAELLVENFYESKLVGANNIGALFALKNMGWADNLKIEESKISEIKVTITDGKTTKRIKGGKIIELKPAREPVKEKKQKQLPMNGTDGDKS